MLAVVHLDREVLWLLLYLRGRSAGILLSVMKPRALPWLQTKKVTAGLMTKLNPLNDLRRKEKKEKGG